MKTIAAVASLIVVGLAGTVDAHPHYNTHAYGHASPANAYTPSYTPTHAPVARYAPAFRNHYPPTRRGYHAPRPYTAHRGAYGYSVPHSYGYVPHRYGAGTDYAMQRTRHEGYNYGYAGGPTFGEGRRPVINGVRVFGSPDGK